MDDLPLNTEQPFHFPGAHFDIVALAASAGGLSAISLVLSQLNSDFPAAITVVQHLDPRHDSLMADILRRRTALDVRQAQEGDTLQAGVVFVAPPDYHLLVQPGGALALSQSQLVHFVRPSADVLFASTAASFHQRAIAVVLSGTGLDGSLGVQAIHKNGGRVIAQSRSSAQFDGMPAAAIETGMVDYILPLDAISAALTKLVVCGYL